MLAKVISGGQTGVDQAALRAALACGLRTGGTMPKGFRTETASGRGWGDLHPEFATLYGMREHPSDQYPPRTEINVGDSCGTLWLGSGDSAGYGCTMRAVDLYERPYLIVGPDATTTFEVAAWIVAAKIKTLNVAGPRESKIPGVGARAERFLAATFKRARSIS